MIGNESYEGEFAARKCSIYHTYSKKYVKRNVLIGYLPYKTFICKRNICVLLRLELSTI